MTLVPELERTLVEAIARQSTHRDRSRWRALAAPGAVVVALATTAVALAASGVIDLGSPVRSPSWVGQPTPSSGNGTIQPQSSRLLSVRTPDPAGGLPWGMRISTTTRGLGCLEVGREQAGELGVLGQDGAFDDDRAFHPLPAALSATSPVCSALDSNRRLIINVKIGQTPASGLNASALDVAGGCLPPGTHEPGGTLCSPRDERALYYGLLGPLATSLTYTAGGASHTVKPKGPDGAYLIVLRASDDESSGISGSLHPSMPITSVTYANGLRCSFANPAAERTGACRTPPGYTPVPTPQYTAAQLASPVHAALRRAEHGRFRLVISFTARVAVTNALSDYGVTLQAPDGSLYGFSEPRNVTRGARVTEVFRAQRFAAGVYHGTVSLNTSATPGQPPLLPGHDSALVGRFVLRVP